MQRAPATRHEMSAAWKSTQFLQRFVSFVLLRYILDGKKKWTLSRPESYIGFQTGVCFFTLSLFVYELSDSTAGQTASGTVSVTRHYGCSDNIANDEGNGKHETEKK